MRSPSVSILAWAKTSDDVEARHLATFGKGFRRIGNYVKLAQVGAQSCLAAADPLALKGANIGVFMGTGLGNTEAAVPLGEGILHAERPWCSPMAFAGSVGNAAAFYVARSCSLDGANVTVSQEELSFEAALLEAVLALQDGLVDLALVGGIDVLDPAREAEHLARLDAVGLPGRCAMGSGWLLLGEVARCPGRSTLIDEVWVGAADVDALVAGAPSDATVLPGWRLAGLTGPTVAAAETRLMSTAAALRIVEVLDGTEPVSTPAFSHVHRTAQGTAARVTIRRSGA